MKIPLSNPDITALERKAVADVLKTRSLSLGPRLGEFEREGARYAQRKYAVAVNSGTSGLHLILKALNIAEGDRVITTPFSFIASANCLLFEKARPVFADIDEQTLNLCPGHVEDILKKDRRRTIKAILAVDVFGHPAEWDALCTLSEKYGLHLIEDSCEAIGAEYRSPDCLEKKRWKKPRRAGAFGAAGVFAFYPNKQITTGEGGLIVTDSLKMYNLCRSFRNQGREDGSGWFGHLRLGYNYRLSDINCALGIAQLQRIGQILKKRELAADRYTRRLKRVEGVITPYSAPHVKVSWFVYVLRLCRRYHRKDRDRIISRLQSRGVASSNYFAPIHLQPFYRKVFGYRRGDFPVTERVSDRTIALPFFSNLKKAEIAYVCDCLEAILEGSG